MSPKAQDRHNRNRFTSFASIHRICKDTYCTRKAQSIRAPMHMPPTYQWMRNRIRPRRVCRQSRLSSCGHSVMALTRHLAYGGAVDQAQARHPLPSSSPRSSSCERVAAGSIRLSSQPPMLIKDARHIKSKIGMDPRGEEWASIPDSDRHTSTPLHIWREQT